MVYRDENEFFEIIEGFSRVMIYNFLTSLILWTLPVIGLLQLLYVIPMIYSRKRKRKWGQIKGIIIGAVITFLLNGGCWIAVLLTTN